tara:strand:+ start:282265 stop:286851 length:4587 start_codon:yes stop_codon:yes gene_type:complete
MLGQSPGGVSGASHIFWLKGNAGVSPTTDGANITSWNDQVNSNNASPSGTAPKYYSDLLNYNPAIDFSTTSGGLTIGNNAGINTTTSTRKSYSIAFTTGSDINTRQLIYEEGGGTHGLNIYILSGELYTNLWVSSGNNSGSTAIEANSSYVLTFVYDGVNTQWNAYLNGALAFSDLTAPANLPSHTGAIGLGIIVSTTQYNPGGDVASGDPFAGSISEYAYYNTLSFSTTERERIESYLGIKYGISQEHDYQSSAGTNIWNRTTNTGFNEGIAGIGRDNTNSDLNQKQGKSAATDAILRVGLGSIFTDNASNTNTFSSNDDFMIWGHNGGNPSFSGSGGPPNELILDRVWKVQETGTVGTVLLQFPANNSTASTKLPDSPSINFLVDSDGDFSSGAVSTAMTLNGTNWEVSLDLSSGDYFSLSVPGTALSVVTNGDENGPVNMVFQVTLTSVNSTGSDITYDFDDAGTGTATSGVDYTAIPAAQKITVPNGQQSGTLSITVSDDAFEEFIETFTASISNPSNPSFTIGASSATATISDNDNAVPAGLSNNLVFWFKADRGSSSELDGANVSGWTDQSGNLRDASQVQGFPTYETALSNFNPTWDYTASGGGMTMADDALINLNSFGSNSFTVAFRTGSDIISRQVIYEQGGGSNGLNLYIDNGDLAANWWASNTDHGASASINANEDYIATYIYDGSNTRWDCYVNGSLAFSATGVPSTIPAHSGDVGLGVIDNTTQYPTNVDITTGEDFEGYFHEMIYYNSEVHSSTNRMKIDSYLALKYGITLNTDYINTSGGTYWNATSNSGYLNDIAGIGVDGITGLEQKQSKSINSDALVSIGLLSIEETNKDNTGSFGADQSFLVWGNDNGSLSGISSNSEVPAQSEMVDRLLRTWKIVETGTVGTVQFAVPKSDIDSYFSLLSFGHLKLRVAANASLNTSYEDISLTVENINGVDHYVCDYDFSGTQYFSIVQSGFILWTGSEWRGGLSSLTDHAPSDEIGDSSKTLFIQSGTDAGLDEAVAVSNVIIASGGVLSDSANTCLIVYDSFTNNGSFNLLADENGYAQYKGPAINATFQQYIPNGGWHSIASPFSDVQWNDISFVGSNALLTHPFEGVSLDTCNYCNLWYYDASSDIGSDIGIMGSNAFGTWRTSVDENENFLADKGWIMYLDSSFNFGDAPWTLSITGTINDGSNSQTVNENNGGWNLVANPYASVIDWDLISPNLASSQISNTFYVWDHSISNYATYNTSGATNGGIQFIAPFQSFFIQTATAGAQNSGDVFRTFQIDTSYQPDPCQSSVNYFKTNQVDNIVLQSENLQSGKKDETVIAFNTAASQGFSPFEDARKLFSPDPSSPNLFSLSGEESIAINVRPFSLSKDSLYIDIKSKNNAEIRLSAISTPSGIDLYLEDLYSGKWYNLGEENITFYHRSDFNKRFLLHFSDENIAAPNTTLNEPVQAYIKNGRLTLKSNRNLNSFQYKISNSSGQKISIGELSIGRNEEKSLEIQSLSSGIYFIEFITPLNNYTQKVFVNIH